MNYLRSLLIVAMCFPIITNSADDSEPRPSMEFLEFLGEWQTDEGEWIDPLQLEDETHSYESDTSAAKTENNNE